MFHRLLCKRRGTLCVHRPGLTLKGPVWRGKNYITRTLKNQDLILYFHNLYTTFPILSIVYFMWIIINEFDLCSSIWYNRTECQNENPFMNYFWKSKLIIDSGTQFCYNRSEIHFRLRRASVICRNCENWNSLLTLVSASIRIEMNLFFMFTLANFVSWGLLF